MLCLKLRVPSNRISSIANGDRAVSADTALRLSRYFGTSAEFWMNLQTMYDLTKANVEVGKVIENEVPVRAA